jgi:hypothetical protein
MQPLDTNKILAMTCYVSADIARSILGGAYRTRYNTIKENENIIHVYCLGLVFLFFFFHNIWRTFPKKRDFFPIYTRKIKSSKSFFFFQKNEEICLRKTLFGTSL